MTIITDPAARAAITAAKKLGQDTQNWVPFYTAVYNAITVPAHNEDYGFGPISVLDAPVEGLDPAVWLWVGGATGVNANASAPTSYVNDLSGYIRDYTRAQYFARTGHEIGIGPSGLNKLQEASNSIAQNFSTFIDGSGESPVPSWTIPTLAQIGLYDAAGAAAKVFNDTLGPGISDYSPWAGTVLFTNLGYDKFFVDWTLTNGKSVYKPISGTYDLIADAQATNQVKTLGLVLGIIESGEVLTAMLTQAVGATAIADATLKAQTFFNNTYGVYFSGIDVGDAIFDNSTSLFTNTPQEFVVGQTTGSAVTVVGRNQVVVGGDGNDVFTVAAPPDTPGQFGLFLRVIDGGGGSNSIVYLSEAGLNVTLKPIVRSVSSNDPAYIDAPQDVLLVTQPRQDGMDLDYNFQRLTFGSGTNTFTIGAGVTSQSLLNADGSSQLLSIDGGSSGNNTLDLRHFTGALSAIYTTSPSADGSKPQEVLQLTGLAGPVAPVAITDFQNVSLGAGDDTVRFEAGAPASTLNFIDAGAGNNTLYSGLGSTSVFFGGSYGRNNLYGSATNDPGTISKLVGGPSTADVAFADADSAALALGNPANSFDTFDSGLSDAIMIGGPGKNTFNVQADTRATASSSGVARVIWGGGGTSDYYLPEGVTVDIRHLPNATIDAVLSVGANIRAYFNANDSRSNDVVTILDPSVNDRIFIGGKQLTNIQVGGSGFLGHAVSANFPGQVEGGAVLGGFLFSASANDPASVTSIYNGPIDITNFVAGDFGVSINGSYDPNGGPGDVSQNAAIAAIQVAVHPSVFSTDTSIGGTSGPPSGSSVSSPGRQSDAAAPLLGSGGVDVAAVDVSDAIDDISPLVLDLVGTGVSLTALSPSSPYFDLLGSGFGEKTGWIGLGTGLLVLPNGEGQVTDISELFGEHGSFPDGFAALSARDSNGDGLIDASDPVFSQLRVWVNPEQDGIVHSGELLTLSDLNIVSINLNATITDQTIAGNSVRLTSTFTLADGTQRTIADTWFNYSPTFTRPNIPTVISPEAAVLPELSGSGALRDLQSAATLDPTLEAELSSFVSDTAQDPVATLSDIKAVMLAWSGSTTIDQASRGSEVDAQQVDFVEKYTGIQFKSSSYGLADPRWRAAIGIREGWNAAYDATLARLVLQTGYDLPQFSYDSSLDFVLPATSLRASLTGLYAELGDLTNANVSHWELALRVADAFRLDARLDGATYLSDVAANTSTSLASIASTFIYGLSYVADQSGRFAVSGTTEQATIYAGANIHKISIAGENTADLASLNDTIVFSPGDGHLELSVTDYSATKTDTLTFATGISATDVTVRLDQLGNLILTVGTTGDQIQIDQFFQATDVNAGVIAAPDVEQIYGINTVQFADGTVWTRDQLQTLATTGTMGADTLIGSGEPAIFDGKGAPAGTQDYELGSGTADTFVFDAGYGQLEIKEVTADGGFDPSTATLLFGPGILEASVKVTSDGTGNVFLTDAVDGDSIQIDGMLNLSPYTNATSQGVAQIEFADGTVWTWQQIAARLTTGTSGNDRLFGSEGADTFDGQGGSDYEQGNGGPDAFVYKPGYGQLEINEDAGFSNFSPVFATSSATLQLGAGIGPGQVVVTSDASGNVYLTDGVIGDRIKIDGLENVDGYWGTARFGVASVVFADGTAWTRQQVIGMATIGRVGADTLYGSAGSDTFDGKGAPAGSQDYEQGQGGADRFVFDAGYGQLEIDEDAGYDKSSTATLALGAGITSADTSVATDTAGDLVLTDGTTGDRVVIDRMMNRGNFGTGTQPEYGVGTISFADGTVWDRTAINNLLAGAAAGALGPNVYVVSAGHSAATLGAGIDTVYFDRGGIQATVNPNGSTGTLRLGPSITRTDVLVQADDAGDLTVTLRNDPGDSVTIIADLSRQWWGTYSSVSQLTFADGSTMVLGQPGYQQGQPFAFTWTGSTASTVLTGSGWGSNTFELGAGGDHVTFGNGSHGGSASNIVLFGKGDGNASINANGGFGTITLGAGISASDVVLNSDDAGDLTVMLRGDTADSITVAGALSRQWWGIYSPISQLAFADGSTLALGQPAYSQGQPFAFTSIGSASNTVLVGSGWGSNTFELGAGSDHVTFGNGSHGGSASNTVLFGKGDGNATIDTNGGSGIVTFGAGISAANLTLQADDATGDLIILDGIPGDSITVRNAFGHNPWGQPTSAIPQLAFADGTSVTLGYRGYYQGQDLAFTYTGSATQTVLTGSGWGSNTFLLAPGNDRITFGNGDNGGPASNTLLFQQGDGQVAVTTNGATGTVRFGAGIIASSVTLQADDATGNLIILDGVPGDAITVRGGLGHNPWGQSTSAIRQLAFADGTSASLGYVGYYQGQELSFTYAGDAAHTALVGSAWGDNTFVMAAGTTATGGSGFDNTFVTAAGEGAIDLGVGARSNTVVFNQGTGAIQVNGNGSSGTLKFGVGITDADITLEANDGTGDLTILDGKRGDSVTVHDAFGRNPWGQPTSAIQQIGFSDGTSTPLGYVGYYQGQPLDFTSTGTADQTTLTGSIWGDNTFILGLGVDSVLLGPSRNTFLLGSGSGAMTADLTASSASARSEIDLTGSLTEQSLWFSRQGGDLVANLLGSTDMLTIKDWFTTGVGSEVSTIRGSDGLKLDTQISSLVFSMANYASNHPGFNPLNSSVMPQDTTLQQAIASAWHT